jgi:hypothetical protein
MTTQKKLPPNISMERGLRQDQQAKTKGELNQLPKSASADFGQGITIWNSSQKRC